MRTSILMPVLLVGLAACGGDTAAAPAGAAPAASGALTLTYFTIPN